MNNSDVSTITRTANGSLDTSFPSEDHSPLKKTPSRLHRFRSRQHGDHSDSHSHSPSQRDAEEGWLGLPAMSETAEVALAALQYLPTPVIVLGSAKTIVVANEAFGRLVGLAGNVRDHGDEINETITERLRGQNLSQIGLDMMSDGSPVWVSWEKFLDNLAARLAVDETNRSLSDHRTLHPTLDGSNGPAVDSGDSGHSPTGENALINDTVVDVIVSTQHPYDHRHSAQAHKDQTSTQCRMIISIWWLDNQEFFTLTFTSAIETFNPQPRSHVVPRLVLQHSKSSQSSYSHTPVSSGSNSLVASPTDTSRSTSAFPPPGAPARCISPILPAALTDFQKLTRMKDAMLGAMHIPVIAMWKDESVVLPNQAARRLLRVQADPVSEEGYDFMSRFKAYTADFSRELEKAEYPIIKLCRTQLAFEKWEIGLVDEKTGKRSTFDVSGYPVFDDKTGEFFAALVAFKDVSDYTARIATQHAENEQQFQLMCNSMPQMLWTTRPDGYHDWFSERWYSYTGLKPEECLGFNWRVPFHPEDMPQSSKKWQHSLATGEEYLTEYRCQSHDGEWRWMLGRALPLRDSKTGKILKWYGSCTDIQATVDARSAGHRARQQLLDVLRHAEMTMWTINTDFIITFFEGNVSPTLSPEELKARNTGLSIYEAFHGVGDEKFMGETRNAIQKVLSGESKTASFENGWGERWFRTKLMPLRGRRGIEGTVDENTIEGVAGISTDVTELKKKEHENIQLLANETAAKEASKMKSNFLANMSHEIRTPIAGVLGMSELLLDTRLDQEQSDFALNIQRSANSLLTVINDILDFSKIESGRLDIEEVQFSLCVVLRDVAKMLSFAAERKKLEFISDIRLGDDNDLILLGDPGRVRQILTNLLTNSIKFTSDGSVKLSVQILKEMTESTTVQFQVADTGIGIEEEVKKRLFKPFSQADSSTARRFGGTGLGLTISKNLVDLMHGEISLKSKLDSGTVATFSIPFKKPEYTAGSTTPLVDIFTMPDRLQSEMSLSCNNSSRASASRALNGSPPPPESPSSAAAAKAKAHRISLASGVTTASAVASLTEPQRAGFHVLVVEDNPVNQQIALKFIKSLKFSVSAVWNGQEALEYIMKATKAVSNSEEASKYPLPSLILMDVQMPVLDGYHCTHILRHHSPYNAMDMIQSIPIVAMTASAIQGDREKCERAGMDDYLAKPVKKATLEKMILKWLAGKGKLRREIEADLETARPDFHRSGTDHSSNCPGMDTDETPSVASENPAPVGLMGAAIPGATTPSSAPVPGPRTPTQAARRSSFSRTLIASQVLGVESESERGLRRAEAEERAASLRNAKLMAATVPHGSPDIDGSNIDGSTGSSLQSLYQDRGVSTSKAGIMALTEENVGRLNADLEEEEHTMTLLGIPAMAHASRLSSTTDVDMAVGYSDVPPHDLYVDAFATPPKISVTDTMIGAAHHSLPATGESPAKVRRDRLATTRKSSDWSTSTAKP